MSNRKKPVFLTDQQKQDIINSDLSNIELVRLYNSNTKTISKIRIAAGKNIGIAGKIGGTLNCKLKADQIKEVLETTTPGSELAAKFGVNRNTIWQIRKKNGFVFPVKEPKPEKISKDRKPKTVKTPKVKEIKPIKIPKKPKTINVKKSYFEEECERKAKALKVANDYHMTEKEKLANGWKWVMGECRSMILKKID